MSEFEDYGTATWRYWQKILNAASARGSYQDRPPVRVRARLEFERDGEVWLDGTATRLGFDGAIFVELNDHRCQAIGAWALRRCVVGGEMTRLRHVLTRNHAPQKPCVSHIQIDCSSRSNGLFIRFHRLSCPLRFRLN